MEFSIYISQITNMILIIKKIYIYIYPIIFVVKKFISDIF